MDSFWKLLRVPIDELKNETVKGGLNVPCVLSMCNSLLLSQLLRLLRSGDGKSMGHVGFWIGGLLGDLVLGFDGGQHADELPEYFDHIAGLVVEGRVSELITVVGWKSLTNKLVYADC